MKIPIRILALLLPLVLALGCKPRQVPDPGPPPSKYALNLHPETAALAKQWREDPLGCKKVRTAPMAEDLVTGFMKQRPSEQELIEVLGPPELSKDYAGTRNLSYYFDATCEGGKLKPGAVYCLVTFTIGLDVNMMDSGGVVCG